MSRLKTILASLREAEGPEAETWLMKHITGGTSAEWISSELELEGYLISATTIKTERRKLTKDVCK